MKKWGVIFIVTASILVLLAWQSEYLVNTVTEMRGRRLFYPDTSMSSLYPGEGRVTRANKETLFVVPKGEGRPIFDDVGRRDQYGESDYQVTVIPAQEQLLYVVARFVRWEAIAGSQDKYMIVQNPKTRKLEQYRVGFERSRLYSSEYDEGTRLGVESVTLSNENVETNKYRETQPEPAS